MGVLPSAFDIGAAERWIDNFGLVRLRMSGPVQRLKKVRLLGTMQYVVGLERNYSRYEHSLRVAYLAYEYCRHWGLSEHLCRMAVSVALVHDIGHLPFSHGSEVFYREKWGQYHTGRGSRLTRHLQRVLRIEGHRDEAVTVSAACRLIAGRTLGLGIPGEEWLHEVFHGVLSADTLDGISRAAESVGLLVPDAIELIHATRLDSGTILVDASGRDLIEAFLCLKERIYRDYIYCSRGIAAEGMLTRALELAFDGVTDSSEFLSLDDDDTIDRLRSNAHSRRIMECLESGELFVSLLDVSRDRYALVSDLCTRLFRGQANRYVARRAIESELAAQMGMPRPEEFILHPSIRVDFSRRGSRQVYLPGMVCSLRDVGGSFGTMKTYGQNVGVLFPAQYASNACALTVVNSERVASRIAGLAGRLQVEDAVDRHLGAYNTPSSVAGFMARWAIRCSRDRVLDPGVGEGALLRSACQQLRDLGACEADAVGQLHGVEIDKERWRSCLADWPFAVKLGTSKVRLGDFLSLVDTDSAFLSQIDVVIANPPYIRSGRLSKEAIDRGLRVAAKLTGVSVPRSSGSWVVHLLCASALLKPEGRLAMVLPLELLSTDYAGPVRRYLVKRFRSVTLVLFKRTVFESIQQDVVILLASQDGAPGLQRVEVTGAGALCCDILGKCELVRGSDAWLSDRWTSAMSDPRLIALIERLVSDGRLCPLDGIADVRLGQVTGANSFFLLTADVIREYGIGEEWTKPVVSRASDITGAILTREDVIAQAGRGRPSWLLAIPPTANVNSDERLLRYLECGRRQGVDGRHKCRTRWPWYSVPMQTAPDAFLPYMSGSRVRLVLNEAKVNSTNTIHSVFFDDSISEEVARATVAALCSSLSALTAELVGRAYGGGVLKLELKEARHILLPRSTTMSPRDVRELARLTGEMDAAMRRGDRLPQRRIDDIVLRRIVGLCRADVDAIVSERVRLSRRRMNRLR